MKKDSKKTSRTVKLAALGAGVAGAAAAAYFFLGPKGKQHRKQARAWAIKMKGDVVEKLETARGMSEPAYRAVVDSVAKMYGKRKGLNVSSKEIQALAKDLKKHWRVISASTRTAGKKSRR